MVEAPPPAPVEAPTRWRDRPPGPAGALSGTIGGLLSRSAIDTETWDDLEAGLLGRRRRGHDHDADRPPEGPGQGRGGTEPDQLVEALKADLKEQLGGVDRELHYEEGQPNVWLFVGVNGVGKTTTIGKLAKHQIGEGAR